MLSSIISPLLFLSALTVAAPTTPIEKRATVQGFDLSHYQANVDFQGAYNDGARFVIIKVHPFRSSPIPIPLPIRSHCSHNLRRSTPRRDD